MLKDCRCLQLFGVIVAILFGFNWANIVVDMETGLDSMLCHWYFANIRTGRFLCDFGIILCQYRRLFDGCRSIVQMETVDGGGHVIKGSSIWEKTPTKISEENHNDMRPNLGQYTDARLFAKDRCYHHGDMEQP